MTPEWQVLSSPGCSIYLGRDALQGLWQQLRGRHHRHFVLMDENTARHCLPMVSSDLDKLGTWQAMVLPAGEASKSIEALQQVWREMTEAQLDRGDILIALGGGMICDLGGFAASCFKRGIDFAYLPTSLLAMVDAAVGGKTGINFLGAKNNIGVFSNPCAVAMHVPFLATLDQRELRAGYAEVLKHYLIHDARAWHKAARAPLPSTWEEVIASAVATKLHFTTLDPHEQGIRKALNFGHTVGHAIESHFLARDPILHGEAVAAGMWCEAWLSRSMGLCTEYEFQEIHDTLSAIFAKVRFTQESVPDIVAWSTHDKKNSRGHIKACLLKGIGAFALDQVLDPMAIESSLHAYLSNYPDHHDS